ncbi:MAG: alpha/beta hydrolase fold domain-containing protein [Bacteroidota bacterium]
MKRTLTLLCIISVITVSASFAQTVVDCNSGRFDTEVFQTLTTTTNLPYGSALNSSGTYTQLLLNVYEPAGDTAATRPLIVWAHGGSFVTGTRTDPDIVSLCQSFAKRGYVCASIEYRLGIPFPPSQLGATQAVYRATQDMKAAVRYFRKDAATTNTFRIDPSTIFVGGSSAGGFMALQHAYLDDASEIPAGIDTVALGNLEGNSGNPGYPSEINAVVNLCGALGDKNYLQPGDEPLCSMHGTTDNTVPYATSTIYLYGVYPIMVIDGSYSVNERADLIGVPNVMYTYYGAGHVPYLSNSAYMDTTVRFVSNFLYGQLGCSPTDPTPLPNTFLSTAVQDVSTASKVDVFPNPSSTTWNIHDASGIEVVQVSDISGRVVYSNTLDKRTACSVPLDGFEKGCYLIHLITTQGIRTVKAIVN